MPVVVNTLLCNLSTKYIEVNCIVVLRIVIEQYSWLGFETIEGPCFETIEGPCFETIEGPCFETIEGPCHEN